MTLFSTLRRMFAADEWVEFDEGDVLTDEDGEELAVVVGPTTKDHEVRAMLFAYVDTDIAYYGTQNVHLRDYNVRHHELNDRAQFLFYTQWCRGQYIADREIKLTFHQWLEVQHRRAETPVELPSQPGDEPPTTDPLYTVGIITAEGARHIEVGLCHDDATRLFEEILEFMPRGRTFRYKKRHDGTEWAIDTSHVIIVYVTPTFHEG